MFNAFFYYSPTITGVNIPSDLAQHARNMARVEECKAKMGNKWVLHPDNHVKKGQAHVTPNTP